MESGGLRESHTTAVSGLTKNTLFLNKDGDPVMEPFHNAVRHLNNRLSLSVSEPL